MISATKTPTETIREMAGGFMLTQMVYTAVKLGIADYLHSGLFTSVSELASAINADPKSLNRFLRMMVVLDLLVQEDDGWFRLSPQGELLRADHPESMSSRILYIGEVSYPSTEGLYYATKTGEPGFDHIFGIPFFEYFTHNASAGALFNELMSRSVEDRVAGVLESYDFSGARRIIDIGGGTGTLIAAIASANNNVAGTIFDSPAVMDEARDYLDKRGLSDRCQAIAGDFFHDSIPAGGDLYLLSNIIHDWDDDHAAKILLNCRSAMYDGSTLLIIEQIMPKRVMDAPVTIASDLSMMLLLRGRERTEEEFRELLSMAGLNMSAIIPFEQTRVYSGRKGNWALIECRPVN